MGIWSRDPVNEERLLLALERIANAVEFLAKLQRPVEELGGDESEILYTNDLEDLAKELRREEYTSRTGKRLPEGEEPPPHG